MDNEIKLFTVQPESCRLQLPKKELFFDDWYRGKHGNKIPVINRVMFFDPTELYSRIGHLINPHKRHQSLQMEQVFPKIIGTCACGCGNKPNGSKEDDEKQWQRKWFSSECQEFASDVLSILNNYFGVPAKYINRYNGNICIKCNADGKYNHLELDHIIPVKHGGGGCWLSNFEWKCKPCHIEKTNKDFGRKKEVKNQTGLDFESQEE